MSVADLSNDSNSFTVDTAKKLEEVLEMLKDKPVSERNWQPSGVVDNSINLQEVEKLENGYWKLEFIKIRDEAMPGKINTEGVFTEIPLEENEYIGEDMTVIYAPDKRLLGIQRNFYSVSANKVAEYLSAMQSSFIFRFEPIIGSGIVSETALVRSVEIGCYDLDNAKLEDAIENVETFGAKRVTFLLSVGTNVRDASLDRGVMNFINRLKDKIPCKKIKLSYKEDVDSPISSIDLIEPKIEDKIFISYSKSDKLTHDKIFGAMLPKFNERYNAL